MKGTEVTPTELRIALSVLAPSVGLSPRNNDPPREGDALSASAKFGGQRMAVCDATGLLAIANGRVIDLYHADAIHVPAIDRDPHVPTASPQDAHLPYAGQIVLDDHLDAYMDNPHAAATYATCVAFIAPGFLLVATATAVDDDADAMASSSSVWLCGFRMYSRSVAIAQRYGPSSLLVYCSFADHVGGVGAITCMDLVPHHVFTTQEAGAIVLVCGSPELAASVSFGVFQWAERFSNRVLSIASLPHTTAAVSTVAVSEDAQWLALADTNGVVHVLDFVRFEWEISVRARSLGPANGKRLLLGASFRMGRLVQKDHPLDAVRLVSQARTGAVGSFGTSLRWWRPSHGSLPSARSAPLLLLGQNDGALTVMVLKKQKGSYGEREVALKTVETYPAIRSLKNEPIVVVSAPQSCESETVFKFSTITPASWRQWTVGTTINDDDRKYRLQWPTLKDSLGLRTFEFASQISVSSLFLPSSSPIAMRFVHAASRQQHSSATQWLFTLTGEGLRAFAHIEKLKLLTNPSGGKALGPVADLSTTSTRSRSHNEEEKPTEAITIVTPTPLADGDHSNHRSSGKAEHNVLITLQDRYKLPPMRESQHLDLGSRSADAIETASQASHQRLTKDQYNSRLMVMAQRVDRLNTNLHALRGSFQLFTDDVQRHMSFISSQLEELQDRSASAAPSQSRH